jgi:hypothetical protein
MGTIHEYWSSNQAIPRPGPGATGYLADHQCAGTAEEAVGFSVCGGNYRAADERTGLGYDPPSYLKDSWILVR